MGQSWNIGFGKTAGPGAARERLIAHPKARLREQFREVCRFRRMSARTEEAYWGWVRRFLVFNKSGAVWRHPWELGSAEVQGFLTDLAAKRGVSASTQNQALNALVFLYRRSLARGLKRRLSSSARNGRSACRSF